MIRTFRGVSPRIAASAYVDPSAVVIGDVSIGERSSIWPNVTLRGDTALLQIGEESSIQDGTVLHADDAIPCTVGNRVTVGHLVMLHGCTVEDDALIGIGAIILNKAHIGKGAVVAAGALVPEGMEVPAETLVMGSPAKPRRAVTPEEKQRFALGVKHYVEKAAVYLSELTLAELDQSQLDQKEIQEKSKA
jgi:gamma-carbonic anhydrase